jgi:hypothetical protein
MSESPKLKRPSLFNDAATSQRERYGLLGASLLKRESAFADIFTERWLSAREATSALGINICTLRKYAQDGRLPCVRLGGPRGWMRFRASVVRDFLEKGNI